MKSKANLLIFLAWLMYSTSYIARMNYSANITQIIDFYGISKAEAGLVPTFFFFAYGIGQVVNGIFCKRYNIKWTIFTSLLLSGVINLVIAMTRDFEVIKWLWLLHGFLLSMLWPTIVRLLSDSLPESHLGKSSVVMGTTVATGTFFIYGLSSILAVFNNFKIAFYAPALMSTIVAIVWAVIYKKAVDGAKGERTLEVTQKSEKTADGNTGRDRWLYFSIGVICFVAIGVNLIKDGLTTWVPSILKEEGSMPDSLSILLTLSLPLFAIVGNAFALAIHKRIPDYVKHCMTLFTAAMAILGVIILGLSYKSVLVMLGGMIIVYFIISSLNSLITSIFPIYMRGQINSGLWAGIINGFCYLGSTVSSYGLGAIADGYGWSAVFWFLFAVCGAIILICGSHALITRKK